jgi:hypothetical protein
MREEEGMPALGSSGTTLGVRLPDPSNPHARADITPDSQGMVEPGIGGSVSPKPSELPPHAVPRRLVAKYPFAIGSDRIRIWRIGEGDFSDGPTTHDLVLRVDPKNARHGFVEPARRESVHLYVEQLWSTGTVWVSAEDE